MNPYSMNNIHKKRFLSSCFKYQILDRSDNGLASNSQNKNSFKYKS